MKFLTALIARLHVQVRSLAVPQGRRIRAHLGPSRRGTAISCDAIPERPGLNGICAWVNVDLTAYEDASASSAATGPPASPDRS